MDKPQKTRKTRKGKLTGREPMPAEVKRVFRPSNRGVKKAFVRSGQIYMCPASGEFYRGKIWKGHWCWCCHPQVDLEFVGYGKEEV